MIVSGLARGIDTCAHQGALDALDGYGKTVAVLAHGLDRVYPPENKNLLNKIIKYGAAISEHPIGTHVSLRNLVRRNRIISGISRGVIVVEFRKEKSML